MAKWRVERRGNDLCVEPSICHVTTLPWPPSAPENEKARMLADADAMTALLRDLLPMVEDWAGDGDDEGAAVFAERIRAILERIDGR